MGRLTSFLNKAHKTLLDFDLKNIIKSQIQHEQSTSSSKFIQNGSLGAFVLDHDCPKTRDVILRKKFQSGEEVFVSALLGPESLDKESNFFWEAKMKVCIKKPGLSSVLQFDCRAYDKADEGSEFDILNASYLSSATSLNPSIYRGPPFRTLDLGLQDELKNYLISKGIRKELTDFIICHIHQKQQEQYVNWLLKLQEMTERIDDPTETKEEESKFLNN